MRGQEAGQPVHTMLRPSQFYVEEDLVCRAILTMRTICRMAIHDKLDESLLQDAVEHLS